MATNKLFLIDGHALCYRSFYAIPDLKTSTGQATNAVLGFVNAIRKILRDHKPAYFAICFDSPGKTLRQQRFAEYKIQRPRMPEDLIDQIPVIKKIVEAYNFPVIECEGYEADDLIATIAKKAVEKDIDVVVATEDKDMYQIVNGGIKLYSYRKDAIVDSKAIEEKTGIKPKQIIDFIALSGDKADNIPGVDGIGDVTARNLINSYGELDDIYKNLEELKPKVKEKLVNQKKQAELSRELAILDSKVPIKYKFSEMKIKSPDKKKLYNIFNELEFSRLAAEFAQGQSIVKEDNITFSKSGDIVGFVQACEKKGSVAVYVRKEKNEILGVTISNGKDVVDVTTNLIDGYKKIFENKKILVVTYNYKLVLKLLNDVNVDFKAKVFDCMLAGFLLSKVSKVPDIHALAKIYLNSTQSLSSSKACLVLLNVEPLLVKGLKKDGLTDLYNDIEIPLSIALFKIEKAGVNLDTELLSNLSVECQKKIDVLTKKINKEAGEEFNINSPKQLSTILFEKLKLPVIKKTKTGYSTDESVLSLLSESHIVPSLILEYRQLSKIKSTYIDALPLLINKETGRIHAEFNQIGTETGRLSSRNPNLQNIPIRTELGREVRKAFIPFEKKHLLIKADYSQIELRILAHLSKDKDLIKAFKGNQDVHTYTASLIFDEDEKDVTNEMRDAAKRVNFGIIYGMSAFGLSKDLKITQPEAQEFINKYFTRYPNVKKFMDDQIALCEKNGYVQTLLNRRRYIPEILSRNNAVKQFAQRQAINTPVQGSAADLIKIAMINIQQKLEEGSFESKMIITVHDELVFDVVPNEKDRLIALIKEVMESAIKISVPISVTIKSGKNWLEMKDE